VGSGPPGGHAFAEPEESVPRPKDMNKPRWYAALASALLLCTVTACAAAAPAQPRPDKSPGPSRWGTVAGTVRGAGGQPANRVLVVPSALDGSAAVPELAVYTDAAGHYEWRLLPGRYALVAQDSGRRSAAVTVTVATGQRATADLQMP
jgi:hypothetical protein